MMYIINRMRRSRVARKQSSSHDQSSEEESSQDELGWASFSENKAEIDGMMRQLMPKYSEYRRLLVESGKEMCEQANIHYDFASLDQDDSNLSQSMYESLSRIPTTDKVSLIDKIIRERRIKRYYKMKHEVNFENELDPDDDQQQIYQFYQQAFQGGTGVFGKSSRVSAGSRSSKKSKVAFDIPVAKQPEYNQPVITTIAPAQMLRRSRVPSSHDHNYNEIVPQTPAYPMTAGQLDTFGDSFDRMKSEIGQPIRMNLNVIDNSMALDHELSFDVGAQNQFAPTLGDDFGTEKPKIEANSKNEIEKKAETDNMYKRFVNKQNLELEKQKKRVEELTQKALKVLNNELDDQEGEQLNQTEEKLSQFRVLMGEMVDVLAVGECLKYCLKFKSYELIHKLYENASDYFGQELVFEDPMKVKYMAQVVEAAIPEEKEEGIMLIIEQIFGPYDEITYQDFIAQLTPVLNDKQFEVLEMTDFDNSPSKTFDLTIRLFDVWIELDYFEKQIKELLAQNEEIVNFFIDEVTQNGMLFAQPIAEFISKGKKSPLKKLKVDLFLRRAFGEKSHVSHLYSWIESRNRERRKYFEEKEQMEAQNQYYYRR